MSVLLTHQSYKVRAMEMLAHVANNVNRKIRKTYETKTNSKYSFPNSKNRNT